jgi:hypothetical protein
VKRSEHTAIPAVNSKPLQFLIIRHIQKFADLFFVKNLTQRRGERRETQRSLGGIYLCAPLRSPRLCVIFFIQRKAGTAAEHRQLHL